MARASARPSASLSSASGRGTRLWSGVVVAVALVAVLVARFGPADDAGAPALFRLDDVAFEPVAAARWVDAATLARGDAPALVRGSPIDAWRRLSLIHI